MTTATTTELVPGMVLGSLTVRLTREQLVRYAGASGDFNPIHFSDHFATALGLPGVIAHGMLTMGMALRVVTDWAGDPARIMSYSARFTRPVVVPDDADGAEVTFTATVVDGRRRRRAGDRGHQRRGEGARRGPRGGNPALRDRMSAPIPRKGDDPLGPPRGAPNTPGARPARPRLSRWPRTPRCGSVVRPPGWSPSAPSPS